MGPSPDVLANTKIAGKWGVTPHIYSYKIWYIQIWHNWHLFILNSKALSSGL
jgi:hypothetical protein